MTGGAVCNTEGEVKSAAVIDHDARMSVLLLY